MSGLLFEFLVTVGVFQSGISIAYLLGLRGLILIPSGFTLGVLLRVLSFTFLEITKLEVEPRTLWLVLVALCVPTAIAVARLDRGFWIWSGVALILSSYGPLVTRGLEVRGRPHSDSLWILFMSDMMQSGGDLTLLGDRTPIKRGFALPAMLALGPDGEFLASFIATVFIAMIFVVFWGMQELGPKLSGKTWVAILVPVILLLMSTPMFYRSIYYINGHTMVALGLGMAAVASVVAIRDRSLSSAGLTVIASALAMVSLTRPEGVALSALVVAPLLASRWLRRWHIAVIVLSALLSFSLWMWVYEGFLIYDLGIAAWQFIGIAAVVALLFSLRPFDWLRRLLVPLAFVATGAVVVLAVVQDPAGMLDDGWAQFRNMFLGEGYWGPFFLAAIAALMLFGWKVMSVEYRNLVLITGLLAMGSLVAKLADGGLVGKPDLGRVGWFDSLNRMWIHLMALLIITLIVGLAEWTKKYQSERSGQ